MGCASNGDPMSIIALERRILSKNFGAEIRHRSMQGYLRFAHRPRITASPPASNVNALTALAGSISGAAATGGTTAVA
jgi:hypothetical protein